MEKSKEIALEVLKKQMRSIIEVYETKTSTLVGSVFIERFTFQSFGEPVRTTRVIVFPPEIKNNL